MKFVNVGNALKVTCVGFAAGVLLRVVQMLYFFDYDTGLDVLSRPAVFRPLCSP